MKKITYHTTRPGFLAQRQGEGKGQGRLGFKTKAKASHPWQCCIFRSSKLRYCSCCLYVRELSQCNVFVNCRCTFSICSMSFIRLGYHITEQYSTKGVHTRINKFISLDAKHFKILFDPWGTLAVISLI